MHRRRQGFEILLPTILQELNCPSTTYRVGRHLSFEVTPHLIGQPYVVEEQVEQVVVALPGAAHADRRYEKPLRYQLSGAHMRAPANVRHAGYSAPQTHKHTSMKDRGHHGNIG